MSYEDPLPYAVAIAEGTEESPEGINDERMEGVVDYLSARTFTLFVQAEDDEPQDEDDESADDRLLRLIMNAIGAAYITGVLDSQPNPTEVETVELSGKSGTPIVLNFYVN